MDIERAIVKLKEVATADDVISTERRNRKELDTAGGCVSCKFSFQSHIEYCDNRGKRLVT